MPTAEYRFELTNTAVTWTLEEPCKPEQNVYHCHVASIREEDGSFSAIVLNLPGAGSCGETEEQALKGADEAVRGLIESYRATGDPIPWRDPISEDIPAGARTKWILVYV